MRAYIYLHNRASFQNASLQIPACHKGQRIWLEIRSAADVDQYTAAADGQAECNIFFFLYTTLHRPRIEGRGHVKFVPLTRAPDALLLRSWMQSRINRAGCLAMTDAALPALPGAEAGRRQTVAQLRPPLGCRRRRVVENIFGDEGGRIAEVLQRGFRG